MNAFFRAVAVGVCLSMVAATGFSGTPAGAVSISNELRAQLAAFDLSSPEPVDVIVKLADEPAGPMKGTAREAQLNRIRTERGNLFSQLRRNGIHVSPKQTFELALNGFTITLPANQLPLLASVPGVIGIYEDVPVSREDDRESAVMNVSAELATSTPAVKAAAAWDLGYRGQGMLVAIIDDGVDYTHPDLGGCLGAGCKVVGGYDYIDLDPNPQSGYTTETLNGVTTTTRDYHGTHVAATAAGLRGVAPDAKILAIRVLGTNTTGKLSNLSNIMAGIEFALRNGADVANMSIGQTGNWGPSTNLFAEMTGNAMKSGMVWVNSNGNEGPLPYKPNIYGSSPHVIAVGNSDARGFEYPRTTVAATNESLIGGVFGTVFPASLQGVALPVVHVGFGNTPAYYAGKNVAGKVAMAMRGGATGEDAAFVNKAQQAKDAGAVAIIIYNDLARSVDFSIPATAIPSLSLSYPNGQKVIASPTVLVASFQPGAQMNSGSSRGPTADLMIKPDVSAPGTDIVAAVPFETSSTGYASLNGTSMAAPHVAGAAALLRQAHPDWTTFQVKNALMNTATKMVDVYGASYRTIEQGAGFLNIGRALSASVSINTPSLSFGQIFSTATKSLTVQASGNYSVSASFIKSYAGASVSVGASSVFSGTSTIPVTVSIAAGSASGEYEGYVELVNVADANDTYRVPFLFVHNVPVSDLKASTVFAKSVAGLNPAEQITLTFNAGRPLADWYFGSAPNATTGAHTRYTNNLGATTSGAKSYAWNIRTSTGQTLGAGNWIIGIWYKLAVTDTVFTYGTTHVRIYVDKIAPSIALEGSLPALTNERVVTVRGAVADTGMFTWGEVGGKVLVNGVRADLFPRSPTVVFVGTGWNSELAFDLDVTLAEGENTITVYAEDASGNRSTQTYTLKTSLDSIAPVTVASRNPAPNAAGWNNTAAALQLVASDSASGVKSVAYSVNGGTQVTVNAATASVAFGTDGVYATSFFATDVAGNVEAAQTVTVSVDMTAPVIVFGGAKSYTVDQVVNVTCTATDNLSGIVGTPCASPLVAVDAWQLALGAATVSVTANDVAGNSTTANATYSVTVTFESLIALTRRFAAGELGNSLVAQLQAASDASARGTFAAMNGALRAYQTQAEAQSGKALTTTQVATMLRLAESMKR